MTGEEALRRPRVVVMGVSASGKSTVAAAVAARLGTPWLDADDLHPAENVAKMAEGTPLEDADRWPWLDRVGQALATGASGDGLVVACSALRRSYRDRLRSAAAATLFVHLTGHPDLLRSRAAARESHFMPPSLLDSQLSTVQPLEHDEPGVTLDVSGPITQIVDAAVAWIDQLYGHAALDRTPHPGTGHPTTIRDVAVVAGVSRGTVSRYFNQPHLVSKSAFERIGKAIDELGFVRNEQAQKLGLKRRQQHAGEVELSSQ